uniref:Uncharacterized protein n=1 Tax=Candidatus Kentrum sp. FM TaxID=2126340 RepID=A0A450SSV4_9GAMM|nr:MAG: hypothetical protein BECKFM1743C_GA0114222_101906 [Candidatus Kentron sp. FM]VFJ57060.1 MAG: hypothetical protein BECKFM1743A_GA0114220_101817 [Candidatus Kentron sp. FM]VFK11511.1 MAG: hypothetical protein BECKFM1743B_GA0114221_101876 [Candidatus Kentron sp. FM]
MADLTQRARFAFGMTPEDIRTAAYSGATQATLGLTGLENAQKLMALQGLGAGLFQPWRRYPFVRGNRSCAVSPIRCRCRSGSSRGVAAVGACGAGVDLFGKLVDGRVSPRKFSRMTASR